MIYVTKTELYTPKHSRIATSKFIKKKSDPEISFGEVLNQEQEKLEEKYTYYKCAECIHGPVQAKEVCVKCGRCGRSFEEDGLCKNIPHYPGIHI